MAWHVDDIKISHVDGKVVTHLIQKLDHKYGKLPTGEKTPLNVTRGKRHEYLGMTLDYSQPNKILIDMRAYI